jgi:hypothetical protein
MHSIISFFYVSNKRHIEECDKEENMDITGAAPFRV